jgi:hypothetical protein
LVHGFDWDSEIYNYREYLIMLASRKFGDKWYVCYKDLTKSPHDLNIDETHIVDGPFDTPEQCSSALVDCAFLYEPED